MDTTGGDIRLYVQYKDIPPAEEYADQARKIVVRNRLVGGWLMSSGVGPYPKAPREHEAHMPKFVAYSLRNPIVCFMFLKSDDATMTVLNNGTMTSYRDMEAATRAIFQREMCDAPIVFHRDVVFK